MDFCKLKVEVAHYPHFYDKLLLISYYYYYCGGLTPGLRKGHVPPLAIIVNYVSAFAEPSICRLCNIVASQCEYSVT